MRTISSRWIFWLVMARLGVCLVWGEFFVLSGPDLPKGDVLHAGQLAREMYCVTDDLMSSVTWNTNLHWSNQNFASLNQVGKPYIVLADRSFVYPANDNLTCQMDAKSSCSHHWSRTGNWSYATSSSRPMAPVNDNRWEDFEEKTMRSDFEFVPAPLPMVGSLAFSIRGVKDAHLALCNQAKTSNSFCYFFILGGWNNTNSVIRQCKHGLPESVTNYPSGDCSKSRAEHHGSVLSPTEWKSFVLKWDFQGKTKLSIYDSEKKLMSYSSSETDFLSAQSYLFARSSEQMFMKFHNYGYSVTTSTQSKLTSPRIMSASSNGNICIEMSISLCDNCQMTLDFIDANNQTVPGRVFKGEAINNAYELPAWHNVKVNKTRRMQQPIRLSINTLFTNSTSDNPFWAVGNIRRCYDGDFKAVKIIAYQDQKDGYFWPNVTCQKISNDGSSIIESSNRNFTTSRLELRTLCKEGKIGKSCSVSCSKLFSDKKDCKSLQACDQTGCSCAPGFTKSSECDHQCTDLTYGYECQRKCGNCTDGSCSFATGECKLGCESDKSNVYLPPFCKIGVSSLPPPNVDVINSTSVRLYTDMKREYWSIPTNVTFEIWENSTKALFVSNAIKIQYTTSAIEAFAERLKPGTFYKSIGIINARNKTLRGDWGNFTTPCTESAATNFPILINETSLTVDNIIDKNVNDSCPYNWYQVQIFSAKKKLHDRSAVFPIIIDNLEPYSDYKIVVKSSKSTIVNKVVKTLEGTPSAVKNMEIVRSSFDSITFTWQPPEVPRGLVANYTAEIRLIESFGCRDLNTTLSDPFEFTFVISNVSQSIFTYKFEGLRPYSRYLIQVYASTSRYNGEKTNLTHSTNSIDVPTETFSNLRLTDESSDIVAAKLRWDPPKNCSNITGPIRAAKLVIGKSDDTPTIKKTDKYYFPLEKSYFNGIETYVVKLHVLRGLGDLENKTNYALLNFKIPPRAPPPVRNVEIIEVDPVGQTTTLRWKSPEAPLHGELAYFSIGFCDREYSICYVDENPRTTTDEFCGPWDLTGGYCKTFALPDEKYDIIQIRAHNANVTEGSKPADVVLQRADKEPSAPLDLSLHLVTDRSFEVLSSWHHPAISGGRINRFEVEVNVNKSIFKLRPWSSKIFELKVTNYESRYSLNLELFPSTTFDISVRAVTTTDFRGKNVQGNITIPNQVKFRVKHLHPIIDSDDTKIIIEVPEVTDDIEGSAVVVLVQGNRHCDLNQSYDDSINYLLNSTHRAWKVMTVTDPGISKSLEIGDGQVYGDSLNHALCSKESYIVWALLLNSNGEVIESIKTSEIFLGEVPTVLLASWLVPLLILLLLVAVLIFVVYRRRFLATSDYLKGKNSNCQENTPLNNKSNAIVEKLQLASINDKAKMFDSKGEPKIFTMPVKVDDFEVYLKNAFEYEVLDYEFEKLSIGLTKPHSYSTQVELKDRNRYQNTVPYDENRVILEKKEDDPYSDYINASYIKGYDGRAKAYIATQGPKTNTVNDFWRMCWKDNVRVICMMANVFENGKGKCEQYWPSKLKEEISYDKISVELQSEVVRTDYTCRTFKVFLNPEDSTEEPREIKQLHYTTWPDHGVPQNLRATVSFLKELHKHAPIPRSKEEPPIVVHCSAGVGRTGTLIVLDMAVNQIILQQAIDVLALVKSAREDRCNMVHNIDQYMFAHLVLLEYLNAEDTCFPCDKFLPSKLEAAKSNEESTQFHYHRIKNTQWMNKVLATTTPIQRILSDKNRMKHRVFTEKESAHRLYLKRSIPTDDDSDYIAATKVAGLFKEEYIATQLPLPTTLGDFWRMVAEFDVQLVLVLQQPDLSQPESYCEILPENQGFAGWNYLKVNRQENSTIMTKYYFKEEVMIIDGADIRGSHNSSDDAQVVKIVNYLNWPRGELLPPAQEMIDLWRAVEGFKTSENSRVVVACKDGVTATGLWLIISFLLHKMSVDKECDIPLAVREVRRCCPDFLDNPDFITYLYDVALKWYQLPQTEDEV